MYSSPDLLCTDQSCAHKIHVYKCKRSKPVRSDKSQQTSSESARDKRKSKQQPKRPKPGNTGPAKTSDKDSAGNQSGTSSSASTGCACVAKVQNQAAGHTCCQSGTDKSTIGDAASHQTGLGIPGPATCHAGHTIADPQALGFQPPTVQPLLETWMESVRKDMLHKQDLMFQVLRMEMLQARPPLGRGAYGLLPSF